MGAALGLTFGIIVGVVLSQARKPSDRSRDDQQID